MDHRGSSSSDVLQPWARSRPQNSTYFQGRTWLDTVRDTLHRPHITQWLCVQGVWCVCVCIQTCVCTCMLVSMCTWAGACVHMHRVSLCVHACFMYTQVYLCPCTCAHTCVVCLYMCAHTYNYVCECVNLVSGCAGGQCREAACWFSAEVPTGRHCGRSLSERQWAEPQAQEEG